MRGSRFERKGSPDGGPLQFQHQSVPLVLHSQFPILLLVPDSLDLVQKGRIERECIEDREGFLERVFREVSPSTRLRGWDAFRRGRLRVLGSRKCAQRRQERFEVALRGDGRWCCCWWGSLKRSWCRRRSWSCRGILGLSERSKERFKVVLVHSCCAVVCRELLNLAFPPSSEPTSSSSRLPSGKFHRFARKTRALMRTDRRLSHSMTTLPALAALARLVGPPDASGRCASSSRPRTPISCRRHGAPRAARSP